MAPAAFGHALRPTGIRYLPHAEKRWIRPAPDGAKAPSKVLDAIGVEFGSATEEFGSGEDAVPLSVDFEADVQMTEAQRTEAWALHPLNWHERRKVA